MVGVTASAWFFCSPTAHPIPILIFRVFFLPFYIRFKVDDDCDVAFVGGGGA